MFSVFLQIFIFTLTTMNLLQVPRVLSFKTGYTLFCAQYVACLMFLVLFQFSGFSLVRAVKYKLTLTDAKEKFACNKMNGMTESVY